MVLFDTLHRLVCINTMLQTVRAPYGATAAPCRPCYFAKTAKGGEICAKHSNATSVSRMTTFAAVDDFTINT